MPRHTLRFLGLCALGFLAGSAPADERTPARFDLAVRDDLFKGFAGDKKAFRAGFDRVEAALKADPKDAEVLVWHGAASTFLAGQKFNAGEFQEGLRLFQLGLKEMDDAVKLAPDSEGVRVPRATTLLTLARFVPDKKQRKQFGETALRDWQFLNDRHADDLADLGTHRRGELLFGLAESYRRTGDEAKAAEVLKKVRAMDPGSKYAVRAEEWLKDPKKVGHTCIGCHGKK